MFLKRKIIVALDRFEDEDSSGGLTGPNRDSGIGRSDFHIWLSKKLEGKEYSYAKLNKCIDDCIEDGYIKQLFTNGAGYPTYPDGIQGKIKWEYESVEQLYVSSKGREIVHWYFFWPAFLKKLSLWEIVVFGVTTGVGIFLASLGVSSL